MAHVPTVPDFSQYNFALGDTDAAITKDNGRNAALKQFGNELRQTMTTFNTDLDQVSQDKDAAAQSATEALQYRNEAQEISETGLPPKAGNAGAVLRVADDEQSYVLDALLRHLLPVGEVKTFPATVAPAGFLKLNGAAISRTEYTDLWAFAQASGNLAATQAGKDPVQFGPGDGATTFTLPDYRGLFPRFWDDGRGLDAGRAIGATQQDQNKAHAHGGSTQEDTHNHGGSTGTDSHNHTGNTNTDTHAHGFAFRSTSGSSDGSGYFSTEGSPSLTQRSTANSSASKAVQEDSHNHSFTTNTDTHGHSIPSDTHAHGINSDGGNEARPVNAALLACIRY